MKAFIPCNRCTGQMQLLNDFYGEYLDCIQCGYHMDIKKDNYQETYDYEIFPQPYKKA